MTAHRRPVARLADLPVDSNKAYKLDGHSVLLCHTKSGIFAVDNRCTHQLATLEGGRMRGNHLFCPKHGARFDLRDGSTVGTLAKAPIRTYEVFLEGEDILVDLSGADASMESKKP